MSAANELEPRLRQLAAGLDGEQKETLARALALCPRCVAVAAIVDAEGRFLFELGYDRRKDEHFYRLPGGGVHFGEPAATAVVREIGEELGRSARVRAHLGTFENLFRFAGAPGHEVVFVFWVELGGDASRPAGEGAHGTQLAPEQLAWRSLAELAGEGRPAYPDGVLALLGPLAKGGPAAEPRMGPGAAG